MLSSLSRFCHLLIAGSVALICAIVVVIPSTASASTDPCAGNAWTPLSAMPSTNESACWHPFTSSSPVNQALPTNPALDSDSNAVQTHMGQYGWHFGDSTKGFIFNESDGTRPLYFAGNSDPTMTIKCTDEEGPGTCQGSNHININGAQVHIPAGAKPGHNWDAHMILVQTASGQEYDLWHTTISGNTITAGNGSVMNVNTSNGTGGSGDAAGLALTAGLLRPSELASGHIDHALAIDVPCTNAAGANVGYSWPATGGWGEACGDYWNESTTGAPTLGQLFKLNLTPSQITNSGAPTWEQTIMTALATYGAYAEDTNGTWNSGEITIFSQDPISYTSIGQTDEWNAAVNQLGGHNGTLTSSVPIPVTDLTTVNPCVPEGTCPNLTGPTANPDPSPDPTTPVTTTGTSTSAPTNTTTSGSAPPVSPAATTGSSSSAKTGSSAPSMTGSPGSIESPATGAASASPSGASSNGARATTTPAHHHARRRVTVKSRRAAHARQARLELLARRRHAERRHAEHA